ncbi:MULTISPECIES: helix-turn-helix domain-containing protein [unclassified Halorhodospira]|uniref:helix-turn-helix domain-containing protein n=1 Tax=unclassified Halorhodospira TaxID=2626748 RepID=UPI001EE78466|nr:MULTISPECIES: helix-turn-helix transcriptional regulator [unclassified Halorhodospira]MCG5541929.1 helix-turn-helix transcriptional regulator [Halorhodospira sp. M39old]MCG5546994.1 helix-turn-helix transcriptional regulator [Halorhodospira sp. M38]
MSTELDLLIRKQARAQGLSLSEVARRANLSRQCLYNLCCCRANPTIFTIVELAQALKLRPLHLIQAYFACIGVEEPSD